MSNYEYHVRAAMILRKVIAVLFGDNGVKPHKHGRCCTKQKTIVARLIPLCTPLQHSALWGFFIAAVIEYLSDKQQNDNSGSATRMYAGGKVGEY